MKHDDAPAIKSPEQEARSVGQREANRLARKRGLPLPYPNIWDALDPTKIDPEDATPEAITKSYREYCKLCPPRKRKRHTLRAPGSAFADEVMRRVPAGATYIEELEEIRRKLAD